MQRARVVHTKDLMLFKKVISNYLLKSAMLLSVMLIYVPGNVMSNHRHKASTQRHRRIHNSFKKVMTV